MVKFSSLISLFGLVVSALAADSEAWKTRSIYFVGSPQNILHQPFLLSVGVFLFFSSPFLFFVTLVAENQVSGCFRRNSNQLGCGWLLGSYR